ncbi:MAG: M28 family peptidase [Candidatus Sulfotelmatobacter sp.]
MSAKIKKAFFRILLPAIVLAVIACNQDNDKSKTSPAADPPTPAATESDTSLPHLSLPPDTAPPPTFNGEQAMQYVKEIVAFGPRPLGSANHKKVEDFILAHLKGDDVENDLFTTDTPEGKFPVHNIIAKFPGAKDGVIVIASHYDTNYPFRNTSFVGANDGGSSSALLLELANQFRGKKNDGYSVWLVWDDAEEAIEPDGSGGLPRKMPFEEDSLYGISHLAQKWQADATLKKVKAFLLADMVGDADLNIEHDSNSTPWLEAVIYEAASRLGYQSHFFARTMGVEDDHLPFVKLGVPAADFIDFDYGYNDVYWHTTQDTVDKLSPKSLQIVGATILETIRILGQLNPLPPK